MSNEYWQLSKFKFILVYLRGYIVSYAGVGFEIKTDREKKVFTSNYN